MDYYGMNLCTHSKQTYYSNKTQTCVMYSCDEHICLYVHILSFILWNITDHHHSGSSRFCSISIFDVSLHVLPRPRIEEYLSNSLCYTATYSYTNNNHALVHSTKEQLTDGRYIDNFVCVRVCWSSVSVVVLAQLVTSSGHSGQFSRCVDPRHTVSHSKQK